jgi:hypothetical protein
MPASAHYGAPRERFLGFRAWQFEESANASMALRMDRPLALAQTGKGLALVPRSGERDAGEYPLGVRLGLLERVLVRVPVVCLVKKQYRVLWPLQSIFWQPEVGICARRSHCAGSSPACSAATSVVPRGKAGGSVLRGLPRASRRTYAYLLNRWLASRPS